MSNKYFKLHFKVFLPLLLLISSFTGCNNGSITSIERENFEIPRDVLVSQCNIGQYGGIFVLNETTQPTTFNPLVPNNLSTGQVMSYLLSGLIDYDPKEEKFIPGLAKSWSVSEDGLVYTFNLRKDIKWSDGTAFTAEDVEFTFDCVLKEKEGLNEPIYHTRYYEQYHIDGEPIKYIIENDFKIRFELPSTYAPFLYDIGFPILPKHKLKQYFDNGTLQEQWTTQTAIESPKEIVGTGAFEIFSYKPGERLVLIPNPNYWKVDKEFNRLPYIDYLIIKFVTESNTAIAHFATGKSDASGIGAEDYEWVKNASQTYDFKVYNRGPSSSVNFFWFNQNPNSNQNGKPFLEGYKLKWFSDKNFRKAVLHSFNREGLIDAVLFGKGEPLNSIIPPAQGKWHNPNVSRYEYSLEKAKELFYKSGFYMDINGLLFDQDNNQVVFDLLLVESAMYDKLGITFVENMKDVGIKVNLERTDFATLLQRIDGTFNYDMTMLGWGSSSAAYDPSGSKALYLSSGDYHMWYPKQKSPETLWEARIDELIKLQEGTLDELKRINYMHEVQAILADELPLLYGYSPYSYVGIKNKWRNIFIPSSGSILWNMEEIWEQKE